MSDQRGFSLVEMLLSVSIITLLGGLSLPLYAGFVNRNDLDLTAQNLASAMRRAQSFARAAKNDSGWGVEVTTGAIVIFKGTSYAGRDTAFDETTVMPDDITPSGMTAITFAELTATPSTNGTATLTSNTNSIRTVTINAKGMVEY
jgi:prepilin-type N-terminal cleavage/methylation domain-containing protein